MNNRMSGQVCIITGANSGIGKATTLGLADMGATVVMVCRDLAKGKAAQSDIIEQSGNQNVSLMLCDLSSQQAIRDFVGQFQSTYERLDVLINNAALVPQKRGETIVGNQYADGGTFRNRCLKCIYRVFSSARWGMGSIGWP